MKSIVEARRVLAEIERRTSTSKYATRTRHVKRLPYFEDLFKEQKDFIEDPDQSKAALCSRRAGKTWAAGAYLLKEAEEWDEVNCLYIAQTRINAKLLMWPLLKKLKRRYNLDVKFSNQDLVATIPQTNSRIFLTGANNASEIEKIRGFAFRLAIIDESASYGPFLEELVDDVIEPTTLENDGTVAMTGTPNAACVGKFHDATTGVDKGWSVHEWTVFDNPFIPNAKAKVGERIEKKGMTWDHPIVQREWLGRWVRSMDSLVYRFSEEKNVTAKHPDGMDYVIGVDLGYHDATSIMVVGFAESVPEVHFVDNMKRVGMLPHDVAVALHQFMKKYNPVKIVGDTGGLGKSIIEEFKVRYEIPIVAAEKTSKADFIELMNSDFISGRIQIDPGLKDFISQLKVLQWDENRKREDSRYPNDCCDSALYAWREAMHWNYEPEPDLIGQNDPEWGDEHERLEMEKYVTREGQEWWERDDF